MVVNTTFGMATILAGPVPQEFSENIINVATEYGIANDVKFSNIGCTFGTIGLYVEFHTKEMKELFLSEISAWFPACEAWAC